MIEIPDLMGWIAGLLTFLAFSMKDIVPLRMAALGANIAFIGWGVSAGLVPILALHCALLPCNLYRLVEAILDRRRARAGTARGRTQSPPRPARPDALSPKSAGALDHPTGIEAARIHEAGVRATMPGLAFIPLPPGRAVPAGRADAPHPPRPAADRVAIRPGSRI